MVYTGYAGGDWTINFERVADALNLVDQGKKVEEDYEKLTEQLKKELEPLYGDKTFSIVRWTGNGPALILKELPRWAGAFRFGAAASPRHRTVKGRDTQSRSRWRTSRILTQTTCLLVLGWRKPEEPECSR